MATSSISATDIKNMALRMLGDDTCTDAEFTAGTLRRAQIANEFYAQALYTVQAEHPWNFNTKRATLYAYQTPASDITLDALTVAANVTDTASVFLPTDVGRQIRAVTGGGIGTIATFNAANDVDVTISSSFGSLTYLSGEWRLYYPFPAWGETRQIAIPGDCLRVWRIEDNLDYQVEQGYIVLSQDTLNCRYSRQEPDTTLMPRQVVLAVATFLAAIMAEPITGQNAKADAFLKKYQVQLQRAKGIDAQEGTPETLEVNALIDVR